MSLRAVRFGTAKQSTIVAIGLLRSQSLALNDIPDYDPQTTSIRAGFIFMFNHLGAARIS
jgi:hypothetical protein